MLLSRWLEERTPSIPIGDGLWTDGAVTTKDTHRSYGVCTVYNVFLKWGKGENVIDKSECHIESGRQQM